MKVCVNSNNFSGPFKMKVHILCALYNLICIYKVPMYNIT